MHTLEVHRVIASTWIGDVDGKDVHHKNHDKLDPRVKNLEILDHHAHGKLHGIGERNGAAKLTNNAVHAICKMLVDGVTCREIAKRISRKYKCHVTTEAVEKISCKKNWASISSLYDIELKKRETMGQFADMRIALSRMVVDEKLSLSEICTRIGIPIKDENGYTKVYKRLAKALPRYVDRYLTTTDMLGPKPGGPFDAFIKRRKHTKTGYNSDI